MELNYSPHLKYLENGSKILDNILLNPKYYLADREKELIEKNLNNIIYFDRNVKNITIIDLGSSSGIKSLPIIKKSLEVYENVEYIPIDSSESSINNCKNIYKNIINNNNFIFQPITGDYEKILEIEQKKNFNYLILFLGSTLGNYNKDIAQNILEKYVLPNSKFICTFDSIPHKNKSIQTILDAYNISEMIDIDNNMIDIINKYYPNAIDKKEFCRKINYDTQKQAIIRWFESDNCKIITELSYKYSPESLIDIINNNIIINNLWYSQDKYCFMVELQQKFKR